MLSPSGLSRPLYLDDARLGLANDSVQRAQTDFARLSSDPRGLLYFEEFLRHGFDAWPRPMRRSYPHLAAWAGVAGQQAAIRRLLKVPTVGRVLQAARSATLMRIAAEHAASRCRRVLTVDLLWSPYRNLLVNACRRTGSQLGVCRLLGTALHDETPGSQLADRVVNHYLAGDFDGLVIPAVDHRGIQLPLESMSRRLAAAGARPRTLIVDGSQALGHVPLDLGDSSCDYYYIGAAHKWLGGVHPLGIGVVGSAAYDGLSSEQLRSDPILRLTQEATGRISSRHGETASLLPLLTTAAALAGLADTSVEQRLAVRQANRVCVVEVLDAAGWIPVRHRDESHGILLAKSPPPWRVPCGAPTRRYFLRRGVAVTCYASGLTRFSLPWRRLSEAELIGLLSVLQAGSRQNCGAHCGRIEEVARLAGRGKILDRQPQKKPDTASRQGVRHHHPMDEQHARPSI